jgi:hypothetical protein
MQYRYVSRSESIDMVKQLIYSAKLSSVKLHCVSIKVMMHPLFKPFQ